MAVQFFDPGGEPYFSLGLASNGTGGSEWSTTANASLVSNAPTGRLTQYAVSVASNTTLDKSFTTNFTEMWMGGAYYLPAGATFGTSVVIMAFLDGTTTQTDMRVNASGQLVATRNGTVLGTSTNALTLGQGWFYVEFRTKVDPTVGQIEIWVNNTQWLSLTGQNTRNTANTQINRVRWGGGISNASNAFWKDVYTLDAGTGSNTTRLGDQTIPVIYVNAAGTNQQWSNTGGASQTASVQDGRSHSGTWPDGDTSYISDSVSGHISDFAHDTLSASGAISAVRHMSYVRSDAGTTNVQQVTISSGTTHTSSSSAIGVTYGYVTEILETDPNIVLTLSSVATGTGVYTGTITGGGSNAFAGYRFTISGFSTAANNGTFDCTASTTTTLTLSNASSVSETHAGTANGLWTVSNFNSATFGVGIP